jgi:NAD(P)-dependent dehydrogenase (short-subunit alcohol dehydrogenase family)
MYSAIMASNPMRYVLISGASTGIGRACVLELANRGYELLAGVRREEDGKALQADAAQSPASAGHVTPIMLDVTESVSIAAAITQVTEITGNSGLCALINNAGISVVGPIEHVSLFDWRRQFEVNFFGLIALTQAALPLLRKHITARGPWTARIVNMSSIAGRIAQPILGPYTASKHALESLTDSLRMELFTQHIHVCSVNPGAIDTPIWTKAQTASESLTNGHPARALYGPLIDGVKSAAQRAHAGAIPPTAVANAVLSCLTDASPKTRYFVGKDARSGAIAKRLIPDRIFDRILRKYFAPRK